MTYKQEIHQQINENLKKKTHEMNADYIYEYALMLMSSRSRSEYVINIKQFLDYLIREYRIKDYSLEEVNKIKESDIINFLDSLTMVKMKTKGYKLTILKTFFQYLAERGMIASDPCKLIPPKRFREKERNEKEVHIPTNEELKTFYHNINNIRQEFVEMRMKAIVALFLGSGIRQEELIGLDIGDLHIDGNQPYIMILGKGNQEVKTKVYISTECIKPLRRYLSYRRDVDATSDAVFVSIQGDRIAKRSLADSFSRYSDGKITPHMLRHLYGSRLYAATKDIELVRRQLRHSSIEVTIKYYVKGDDTNFYNTIKNMNV